jgi:hypothetical protein
MSSTRKVARARAPNFPQSSLSTMTILTSKQLGAFACVVNFGILAFNVGFQRSSAIASLDANVFSPFGQAMVLVWGCAFLAAGMSDGDGRSLTWLAFSLEKSMYVGNWLLWHASNSVPWADAQKSGDMLDLLAPLFISFYGLVDLTFLLLFFTQGLASLEARKSGVKKA